MRRNLIAAVIGLTGVLLIATAAYRFFGDYARFTDCLDRGGTFSSRTGDCEFTPDAEGAGAAAELRTEFR